MQPFDTSELYETRLVVLLEEKPQSNTYRQIMLDPLQFKDFSGYLQKLFPAGHNPDCDDPECTGVKVVLSDNLIPLPDMQSIHLCKEECSC